MEPARILLTTLLMALLAGCTAAPESAPENFAPAFARADAGDPRGAVDPPGRGDRSSHGEPQRIEHAPQVIAANASEGRTEWSIEQVLLVQNDLGGADESHLRVHLGTGDVRVHGWEHGGYRMVATVSATGADEQSAWDSFRGIGLAWHDRLHTATLQFGVSATYGLLSYDGTDIGIVAPGGRDIQIDVYVPADVAARIDVAVDGGTEIADLRVGPVEVQGDLVAQRVQGHRLDASSLYVEDSRLDRVSGDALELRRSVVSIARTHDTATIEDSKVEDLRASGADLVLSEARIHHLVADAAVVSGTLSGIDVRITHAAIDLVFTPLASGHVSLDTGAEDITFRVVRTGHEGVDALGRTDMSDVIVEISDGETLSEDTGIQILPHPPEHKHVRSVGYDDAPIQVHLVATSDRGVIELLG